MASRTSPGMPGNDPSMTIPQNTMGESSKNLTANDQLGFDPSMDKPGTDKVAAARRGRGRGARGSVAGRAVGAKLGRSRIAWLKNNWVLVALILVALLGFLIMIALLAEQCEANIVTVSNVVAAVLAKNVSTVTITCADEVGTNVGTVPCLGTQEIAEICGPKICQNSTRQSLIAAAAKDADGKPIVCRDCIKGVRKGNWWGQRRRVRTTCGVWCMLALESTPGLDCCARRVDPPSPP
jgi:hypothetical protein